MHERLSVLQVGSPTVARFTSIYLGGCQIYSLSFLKNDVYISGPYQNGNAVCMKGN